ncbi:hypothetical protein LGM35_07325 [Burkholderia cenocepacia]|uniref:hypothetical protein n=1 Tax=Burkholderia cenocepacia TaxID=95486 RepID=UPI001CF40F28|nr:hypothetical protein [Burkholderia cenocepacia]MCA7922295.1 hypothetical protein [Burkholderia cenocepacia]
MIDASGARCAADARPSTAGTRGAGQPARVAFRPMQMSFEYRIHTPSSGAPIDAVANVLRQAYRDIDVYVDPHERQPEILDAASGWPLIDLSIEAAVFRLVTTLGPKRNAMLDATGRALSGIDAPWRIDDA